MIVIMHVSFKCSICLHKYGYEGFHVTLIWRILTDLYRYHALQSRYHPQIAAEHELPQQDVQYNKLKTPPLMKRLTLHRAECRRSLDREKG